MRLALRFFTFFCELCDKADSYSYTYTLEHDGLPYNYEVVGDIFTGGVEVLNEEVYIVKAPICPDACCK